MVYYYYYHIIIIFKVKLINVNKIETTYLRISVMSYMRDAPTRDAEVRCTWCERRHPVVPDTF